MTQKTYTKRFEELSPLEINYKYRTTLKTIEIKYKIERRSTTLSLSTLISAELLKKKIFSENYVSIYDLQSAKLISKSKNSKILMLGHGLDSNLLPILPRLIEDGDMVTWIHVHKDIELQAQYKNSQLSAEINKVQIALDYKEGLLNEVELDSTITGRIKLVRV